MSDQGGISVSRLNMMVSEAIRKDPRIRSVTVVGEVSGFRNHIASGHWYFSMKDEESSVSCVMFRQNTLHSRLRPRDGQMILVSGYVDVYPRNGSYQLYVTRMQEAGQGDVYARLEALKKKLYAEGLFDDSRKKTLPMVPGKVAVVTSASGAALQDILNVSAMRSPFIPIVLVPVTVQGDNAAAEIVRGIRKAWQQTDADVIIIARGGGSAEDLWCFNDEAVVRAVAESRIPVVSGVGHEIDITLCDLAADFRASTPSNAAEVVFPDREELKMRTYALRTEMAHTAGEQIRRSERKVQEMIRMLGLLSPERKIRELTAGSCLRRNELIHAMRNRMATQAGNIQRIAERLDSAISRQTEKTEAGIRRMRERLQAIDPMAVLNRGYTLVYSKDGSIITSKEEALPRPVMKIRFHDGEIEVCQNGRK